jgi:hypothetical protein
MTWPYRHSGDVAIAPTHLQSSRRRKRVVGTMLRLLYPKKETWYSLYRRLGGPLGQSGQVQNILSPTGLDPWTLQPVVTIQRVIHIYHSLREMLCHNTTEVFTAWIWKVLSMRDITIKVRCCNANWSTDASLPLHCFIMQNATYTNFYKPGE